MCLMLLFIFPRQVLINLKLLKISIAIKSKKSQIGKAFKIRFTNYRDLFKARYIRGIQFCSL